MKRNLAKIKHRRKIWNIFGWKYKGKGLNFLSKNHSLNCGCIQCKMKTYQKKLENKQERLKSKTKLREYEKLKDS